MLVGVYLDKGRVSDTPKSAETGNSETLYRHFENYKQTKEQHIFKFTAAFSSQPQALLAAPSIG